MSDENLNPAPVPDSAGEPAPLRPAMPEAAAPGSAPEDAVGALPVAPEAFDPYGWHAQQAQLAEMHWARRRFMLRRLRLILLGTLAAFCIVTWGLVRSDSALLAWLGLSGPSRVVRQHLDALNRGEARVAYEFFSTNYRGQIPLAAYEQLVRSHRAMFRTQLLSMATPSQGDGVAVLDTRLASASGTHYIARFTMVRIEGKWFIDRIRWSEAPHPSSFTRI